ncbi:hypothetical protein F5Y08DRAFT_317455 [Xylaria arbuscula]|nr:hypothetical protein F5Y08DRAFT_317455 [Xylaria arbuscula]
MPPETSVTNHGSGPQNAVTGSGPQSNFNGSGTQNNYYGVARTIQPIETERLHEQQEREQERKRCLNALKFSTMNSRRNNIDDAYPSTCDWLFQTTKFKRWRHGHDLRTHNGVLWIKGKPGAGKSTLMNHTLSYCRKAFNDHLIVSHFFNGRGDSLETTPLGMMRSIVYQLVSKSSVLLEAFLEIHDEHLEREKGELQYHESGLRKFLRSVAKQPDLQSKPLLFLIDALDECVENDIRDVVGFLESLSVNAVYAGVELRICLSSRYYPWISMKRNLELTVEKRHEHGKDIATYVREKLIVENICIEQQLQQKAGGVFMWVVLVVAMLNKAYDEGRDKAMQKTLDEIPEGLEGIFNGILAKNGPNKNELIEMLQWVLLSQRRLKPGYLYAMVVGEPIPCSEILRRRITSSSRGLIEIRKHYLGDYVQFIHVTVKDFLCRNRRLEKLEPALEPDAIAASHACIWARYWSYIQSKGGCNTWFTFDPRILDNMLYHAEAMLSNATIASRFETDICRWLEAPDDWIHRMESTEIVTDGHEKLIYTLTFTSYPNLFNLAVDKGADINATLSRGYTLLQCALHLGNYEAVQLLIQRGVEVNRPDDRDADLRVVVSAARYNIAELLIENGLNIHAPWGTMGNTLQCACYEGNTHLVELLIKKGVDVNTQSGKFGNALQAACVSGSYSAVQWLLESGANVNAQGGFYEYPLQAASLRGDERIVKLLLRNGANVNARGGPYGDAHHAAAYGEHGDIVGLLFENDAVHAQDLVSDDGINHCKGCRHRCVLYLPST